MNALLFDDFESLADGNEISRCRGYWIARTAAGDGSEWWEAWTLRRPQAASLPGGPFRSIEQARNACRLHRELAAQPLTQGESNV